MEKLRYGRFFAKSIGCFIAAYFLGFTSVSLASSENELSVVDSDDTLTVMHAETPVLVYHKAMVPPPEGVSPVYYRNGFIHPLRTPSGAIVTGMHPDDHYHHLGLWHAWVKTEYGDQHPDFWNLGEITGRVQYAGTEEIRDSGFTVSQQQVAYLNGFGGKSTEILAESLAIDVGFVDGANVIDYRLTQKNVTDLPLVLPAYRYGGGIAYRAPHSWDMDNSDYLTSEGFDRTNSHQTRARWVAMFGPAEDGDDEETATVVVLCSPENHDFPQRLRTWDNGKIFLNYVPIQETGWSIGAGEAIDLSYRIVIFDGRANVETIEARWKEYADSVEE